jgi:hypothetical protein
MTGLINQLRPEEIRACAPAYVAFYDEVQHHLRQFVGDTAHHFVQRARQQQQQQQQPPAEPNV